uniref:Predicted gene, EG215472 n=1 Tax=Mus musculus TaxID=10090 RepID=Q569Q2_MOUSE|nr:Predicted gene, EG215472 [Mus musculus]
MIAGPDCFSVFNFSSFSCPTDLVHSSAFRDSKPCTHRSCTQTASVWTLGLLVPLPHTAQWPGFLPNYIPRIEPRTLFGLLWLIKAKTRCTFDICIHVIDKTGKIRGWSLESTRQVPVNQAGSGISRITSFRKQFFQLPSSQATISEDNTTLNVVHGASWVLCRHSPPLDYKLVSKWWHIIGAQ